ncbi:MAG TPA: PRC-barrel domain-containing protein [Sandaracinaceae bacterium LLY-WYZ-13_1]|nr:PRC-barrel domain-containing protein [Sandaracinaceae bacterium LLY-WYZ-13_1]
MSEIKFSELEGKGVLTQDGREIGEVTDCVVDHAQWSVLTLVVKLERDLLEQFHMKRPMFGTQTVQLPTSYVSGVSDKVVLHKKLEELTTIVREKAEEQQEAAQTEGEPEGGGDDEQE